ncbi:thioesterase II family protein [Plesiocystis pacifica]|uniref:thioesterase II family protein n=1 Tax=Plesiocystis pacifica TaxID=191768 RepID=UPI0005D47A02|nr:alpha/beta fold hydrolase [Plesiocystis pacifica]
MSDPSQSPWLVRHRPRPHARVRLICIPFAGGAASVFRPWSDALPESIEVCAVQLPGRERRLREPLYDAMDPLMRELVAAIGPSLQSGPNPDQPFAIFGHSLGACVGFELARQLRRLYGREPVHLFASARRAPHLPDPAPLHALPEDELAAALRRMGGTPETVLADPELMRIFVPILRADLSVAENYLCPPGPRLRCPMTMLRGDADPMVTKAEALGWREHTRGPFTMRTFAAGHLFLGTHQGQVLELITTALAPVLRAGATPASPLDPTPTHRG